MLKGTADNLYATLNNSLFRFDTAASQWQRISTNVPALNSDLSIYGMEVGDSRVLLKTWNFNDSTKRFRLRYVFTANKGKTWRQLDTSIFSGRLIVDATLSDSMLIVATRDAGVYKSYDQGKTWQRSTTRFYNRPFRVRTSGSDVITATNFKLYKYFPDIQRFRSVQLPQNTGADSLIYDITSLDTGIYLEVGNRLGIFRNQVYYRDGLSASWQEVSLPPLPDVADGSRNYFFEEAHFHKQSVVVERLYKDTVKGLTRKDHSLSIDKGQTWQDIPFLDSAIRNNHSISGLGSYHDNLMLKVKPSFEIPNHFYISPNNGQSWRPLREPFTKAYPESRPGFTFSRKQQLWVVPDTYETLDTFYTYNDSTWQTQQTTGLEAVTHIRQLKYCDSAYYLLSDQGIYQSTDTGRSWQQTLSTPTSSQVEHLSFARKDGYTVLGTKDGLYQYTKPTGVSSVDNPQTELTVSPNPARASTVELTLSIPRAQFLKGSLYDANGRRVQAFQWQHGEGKDQKTLLLNPSLPDGIYVLHLRGQDQVYSQKLIKQ